MNKPRSSLQDALRTQGITQPLRGNQPYESAQSAIVYISAGMADLFYASSRQERIHCVRARAGEILVLPPSGGDAAWQMYGHGQSEGIVLSPDAFAHCAVQYEQDALKILCNLTETLDAAFKSNEPSCQAQLATQLGCSFQMKPGDHIPGMQQSRILRIRAGQIRWMRHTTVDRGSYLLCSRHTSIEALQGTTFDDTAMTTDAIDSICNAFLDMMHNGMTMLQQTREESLDRVRKARMQEDMRSLRHANKTLQRVVHRDMPAASHQNDLHAVIQVIAREYGCTLPETSAHVSDPLVIAKYAGMRARRVLLTMDLHQHDAGPLLVWQNQRPLALLPHGDGYRAIDASATENRLDASQVQELDSHGYAFFRRLPQESVRLWDVLRMALIGNLPDLRWVLLIALLTGILSTALPYLTSQIVDDIIPSGAYGMLLQFSGILATATIASGLFAIVQQFCMLRFATRGNHILQSAMWDRLISLPIRFFGQHQAGDLAQRVGGISTIRDIVSSQVLSSFFAMTIGVFNGVVMLFYSWQLSLVIVAFSIILTLASLCSFGIRLRYQRKLQDSGGRLSGMVLQFITGINKLRTGGAEAKAFARWSNLFAQQRSDSFCLSQWGLHLDLLFGFIPLVQTALIYYLAGYGFDDNTFTTGMFMGFTAAAAQFSAAVTSFSGIIKSYLSILPHYERARPILDTAIENHTSGVQVSQVNGAIEVHDVNFAYSDEGENVLHGVSLKAAPGEFIAIVGPSGSGKSTLLKLLLGFDRPDTGTIRYDTNDITELDLDSLRKHFGVVLQGGAVMAGSILDNIRGAGSMSLESAWKAASQAGFERDIREMPMQMHTVLPQGGGVLSGGQRQRLMIARALAGNPSILFFDEATSALDNRTQAEVSQNIDTLQLTRIVVAHRLSTIRKADRIYVMEKGQLVQSGNFDSLMAEPGGLFAALAQRQMLT